MAKFRGVVRRVLRRCFRPLCRKNAFFVYHPAYEYAIEGVPFDPLRGQRIVAYLHDEGLIDIDDLSVPICASMENVSLAHSTDYLESLDSNRTIESVLGFGLDDNRWQGLVDAQRWAVGGTIQATRLALRSCTTAINLCGGFHHATPDRGIGFCVFNDIAIAVSRLRAKGFDEPILVIDLDIHDGNGTRAFFANDDTVHTFSIHNDTWNSQDAVADTCIPLGQDVRDDQFLEVLTKELPPVVESHRPGLVIYVAATDPASDDKLGNWQMTAEGLLTRDKFVIGQTIRGKEGAPLAILLGGGYGDNSWRYSARFLGWLLSGKDLDPQEDIDAIVRRFRRIERAATSGGLVEGEKDRESDWVFTEEDLDLVAPPGQRQTKVLGEYSRHAMEVTLERLGILKQIRAKGFSYPIVSVSRVSSLGHTIRIFGDENQEILLMELRMRTDKTTIPNSELLYAEWLLLQNPREVFTPERQRLPGQDYPGLGLLPEIVALMVVMCERAGLDGIMFVPAHYYMAALGRRHLIFVRPEDETVFEALQEAVQGLGLADATRAIENGQVVDQEKNQPVEWHTPLMVLPISQRLRDQFETIEVEGNKLPEGAYRLANAG